MKSALFEDDGQLKFGNVLATSEASSQIETREGRRLKVKSTNILFQRESKDTWELKAKAEALRESMDLTLLWESADADAEKPFTEYAELYFGESSNDEQICATLLALHSAPMYFYKRGKGIYRPAPEASLKAALAGAERKAREAAQIEQWVSDLVAGNAPDAIASQWLRLLFAPDKQSLEYKALSAAVERARMAPVALLSKCGVIRSTHALHFGKFLLNTFPKGTEFPAHDPLMLPESLPLSSVRAFSIDDDSTTEIDDAFSVERTDTGYRVGIHIAAPALGISPNSSLDRVARDRLSTVYMPGRKITMLPEAAVSVFSLDAGRVVPAVSLYLELDAALEIKSQHSKVESVTIAENLRIPALEASSWMEPGDESVPFASDLRLLFRLCAQLQAARAEQNAQGNRIDYNFDVIGEPDAADARIEIKPRERGSAIDVIVSELMIYANVAWAKQLAERGLIAMYRVQGAGKTKMSSQPGAHEGLNVPNYLWATSPLRRFSDLLNQRQIIAAIRGESPVYARGDALVMAAIADFDATYSVYADFQQQMEFYWCLRYLLQEKIERVTASVIRENLVRFDHLPIVQRISDMTAKEPGTRVLLAVAEIDLLEPALHTRFIDTV